MTKIPKKDLLAILGNLHFMLNIYREGTCEEECHQYKYPLCIQEYMSNP